ncbi:MAG TPA: M28 family peptidase [Flavobacteriales bacterium]|nr:M28 family peptidase [Flavobacteriales bacterium]HIN40049.1 M28 family peptidase [Flavobacteriales bacterium]
MLFDLHKKTIKQAIVGFILLLSSSQLFGQDISYAKETTNILASEPFQGRGYINKGDSIAASWIKDEFERIRLSPFEKSFFQHFQFSVNTFPGAMEVRIDKTPLSPGKDYIVSPSSKGISGSFNLFWLQDLLKMEKNTLEKHIEKSNDSTFIVIDENDLKKGDPNAFFNVCLKSFKAKGIILIKDKLTWGVSQTSEAFLVLEVMKSSIPKKPKTIHLNIENVWVDNYRSQNIIAHTQDADSFIVFTAHYDHLGKMGHETMFPGANDNASGVSVLLDLANHYNNKTDSSNYCFVFIAFAGEEAGLIGSEYFTEHPLFSLNKIKFLINLDLMGNGEEGITVVNGTLHKKEFETLVEINNKKGYLTKVNIRGKAKNSDHYYFTEKKVPAFFIYTLGENKAYHDIYDIPETLLFPEYNDLFHLLTDFIATF